MFISLKDNQFSPAEWNDDLFGNYDKEKYEHILEDFNGISLNDLHSDKWSDKKYLVFPGNVEKELNKKDNFIYKLDKRKREKPAFQTGNIMGFFSLSDEIQMRITSRFDDGKKNFFLHYMLQKVCNVAFAPQTSSAEDELQVFLYYLFPTYLRAACTQGIYRAYVTREYNDANVRGPIDVARHIRYNIPFNGKIAYHTREYTTDNKVTQLVRHTIEFIQSLSLGSSVLGSSEDVRDDVNAIVAATQTYSRNSRQQIISQNLHPVTHPYYTAYESLRKLCIAILQHKKISYGDSNDKNIRGILFDGASLWEEYLAKVFEEYRFDLVHSNNRLGENGIYLFKNSKTMYFPDFYRKNPKNDFKNGDGIIIDAKYKRLFTKKNEEAEVDSSQDDENENDVAKNGDRFRYNRDDLYQMLAYMHCLKANKSYLVSPYQCNSESREVKVSPNPREAEGLGGTVSIIAIPIPAYNENVKWNEFREQMKKTEMEFIKKLREKMGT